jgi:hypothetical protein
MQKLNPKLIKNCFQLAPKFEPWSAQMSIRVWKTSEIVIKGLKCEELRKKSKSVLKLWFWFPQNWHLTNIRWMEKKVWKMLEILRVMLKNMILIHHFRSIHYFLLIQRYLLPICVADEKENSLQKSKRRILDNSKVMLFWI